MNTVERTTTINPIEILERRGFHLLSDLPFVTHNGNEFHVGYSQNVAAIVAMQGERDCIVLPKYEIQHMVQAAKIKGINFVLFYTNCGLELHRTEKPECVGIDAIHKLITDF